MPSLGEKYLLQRQLPRSTGEWRQLNGLFHAFPSWFWLPLFRFCSRARFISKWWLMLQSNRSFKAWNRCCKYSNEAKEKRKTLKNSHFPHQQISWRRNFLWKKNLISYEMLPWRINFLILKLQRILCTVVFYFLIWNPFFWCELRLIAAGRGDRNEEFCFVISAYFTY